MDHIKILPHDRLCARTILMLFPKWVKPNHLTILRMLMIPLVLWFLVMENYEWGIPLFLLAALTDSLDGSMARTRNQITDWGKIYDPVADKALIGSVMVVVVLQHVNFYLGIVLIALEVAVLVGAAVRYKKGIISQANVWGKIKMLLQVVGVTFILFALAFGWNLFISISQGTFFLAIIFAIISLLTHGF